MLTSKVRRTARPWAKQDEEEGSMDGKELALGFGGRCGGLGLCCNGGSGRGQFQRVLQEGEEGTAQCSMGPGVPGPGVGRGGCFWLFLCFTDNLLAFY